MGLESNPNIRKPRLGLGYGWMPQPKEAFGYVPQPSITHLAKGFMPPRPSGHLALGSPPF